MQSPYCGLHSLHHMTLAISISASLSLFTLPFNYSDLFTTDICSNWASVSPLWAFHSAWNVLTSDLATTCFELHWGFCSYSPVGRHFASSHSKMVSTVVVSLFILPHDISLHTYFEKFLYIEIILSNYDRHPKSVHV